MTTHSPNEKGPIDPDPWTVISVAISAVAMFAQLASLRLQKIEGSLELSSPSSVTGYENLRDAVENAERDISKIIRILATSKEDVLKRKFLFGESELWLDPAYFGEYQRTVGQLSLHAGMISSWTLQLVSMDATLVQGLKQALLARVENVVHRINSLHTGSRTNESVLDECLFLMREFIKILSGIDKARN